MKKIGHYISGKKIYIDNNNIDLYNPNTGEKIGLVSCANKKLIDQTINSSNKAFNQWKEFSISKRASVLFEYKVLLEKNINKIAELIRYDLGKVKNDAIGEIRRGIENVEYACGIGEILKGEYTKNVGNYRFNGL